jgi:hypothetical protein
MARKFVISLVVLAMTFLTYAPTGGTLFAMTAIDETAMADRAAVGGDGCKPADKTANRLCADDGSCLVNCAGATNLFVVPSSMSFAPASNSTEARPDPNGPASALGLLPFRPPRPSLA